MKISHFTAVLILTICSGCSTTNYAGKSFSGNEAELNKSIAKSIDLCMLNSGKFKEKMILAQKEDLKKDLIEYYSLMQNIWSKQSVEFSKLAYEYANKQDPKYSKQKDAARGKSIAYEYCSTTAKDARLEAYFYQEVDAISMLDIVSAQLERLSSYQKTLLD